MNRERSGGSSQPIKSYLHGNSEEGLRNLRRLDLSVGVHPFEPPMASDYLPGRFKKGTLLAEAVLDEARNSGHMRRLLSEPYHHADFSDAEANMRERLGIQSPIIFRGSSDEILQLLPLTLPPDATVFTLGPGFQNTATYNSRILGPRGNIGIPTDISKPQGEALKDAMEVLSTPAIANKKNKVLVMDWPNPAGDYASYDELRSLAAFCSEDGIILQIDGAFSGTLQESGERLVDEFPNVRYVGSFSKSLKTRGGYAVLSPEDYELFVGRAGRPAAAPPELALKLGVMTRPEIMEDYLQRLGVQIRDIKVPLVEEFRRNKGLFVPPTKPEVPIGILGTEPSRKNFASNMEIVNLGTVSGEHYRFTYKPKGKVQMDGSLVRFTIPGNREDIAEIAMRANAAALLAA